MTAKFWRKRRTPREEQMLIDFARKHTIGGLHFDRTGLCQFVDALHQEMLSRPLSKQRITQIANSIDPSNSYLLEFADAIQKEVGIKDEPNE